LSLSLGIPIGELQDRMTAKEVKSWERYKTVNGPYGQERNEYYIGLIVSIMYLLQNTLIAVNGGEPSKTPTVEDCILKFETVQKDETENESDPVNEPDNERLANEINQFLSKRWK
jgi:hypothetical protein